MRKWILFSFLILSFPVVVWALMSPGMGGGVPAAGSSYENFSTYTEVDTIPNITLDTNYKLTYDGVPADDTAYLYKDRTSISINQDFRFEFTVTTAPTGDSHLFLWGLAEDSGNGIDGDLKDADNAGRDYIATSLRFVSGAMRIYLDECIDGSVNILDAWIGPSESTKYYVTVTGNSGSGSYGGYTVVFRTGSHGNASPEDTLTGNFSAAPGTLRFHYAVSSCDNGSAAGECVVIIENLELL